MREASRPLSRVWPAPAPEHEARARTWAVRVPLLLAAAAQAQVGLWGEIAPRSFFAGFPGLGHHWVAPLGPYNEHLLRDYAAAELGLAVVLGAAALWPERRLLLVAGAAFLAATLPHFAYHLATADALSTTDDLLSLSAFAIEILLVVGAVSIGLRSAP